MFLILLSYKKPIEIIDQYLVQHRAYLDECYQKNYLICSGPKNPRTGGVLISQLNNQADVIKMLENDPFTKHDIADYEIIEFQPVKYHQHFKHFVENNLG